MKHAVDEKANEILRARGIERGVGAVEEWDEARRSLLLEEGRQTFLSDKYEHDILEDYFRQGVTFED